MDIFIQWLIANSLKGAVLIIAVFLVQFVFSKQIPPKWKYLMWLLVAIRLVMPSLLELDSSIFNLKNVWQTETINSVALSNQATVIETSLQQTVPIDIAVPENGIELSTIVFSVWATVAIFLSLYLLWKNLSILALIRKEKPITKSKWLELLENCKQELKLYTPVQLVETRHIKTPALMGFIRPRILLPEGILNAMTESEIKLIFMHELTHLKCGDIMINWTISLIQIVHWFNPLVWIAFAKTREARELACDDDMLSFLGQSGEKKYGQTIIRLLDLCYNENCITGMVGILENKKQINRRIKMIKNRNRKTKRTVVFALILLSVMGTVFLSEAKEKKIPTEVNNANEQTIKKLKSIYFPQISFSDAHIFSVIRFLNSLSKRCDPDKVGITFIAGLDKKTVDTLPKVTMSFTNIPISELLRYVCRSLKIKYKIEKGVVILLPIPKGTKEKEKPVEMNNGNKNLTLSKKLKSIIIPRLDFESITVETAVQILHEQSKKLDKDGVGVNIVALGSASKKPVDIVLVNRSLYDVIYFICKANGLKFRIEKNAVVIADKAEKTSKIEQKLKSIIIPSLDLESTTVKTAVQFLNRLGKRYDPNGVGVNIILMVSDSDLKKSVDLVLKKKSLYDAIYFLCKASGLRFRIQKNIVLIADKTIVHDGFETKTFQLKPGALAAAGVDNSAGIKKYFEDRGVKFPVGAKLLYARQKTPFFIMKNTRDNINRVESIVQNELNKTKPSK